MGKVEGLQLVRMGSTRGNFNMREGAVHAGGFGGCEFESVWMCNLGSCNDWGSMQSTMIVGAWALSRTPAVCLITTHLWHTTVGLAVMRSIWGP